MKRRKFSIKKFALFIIVLIILVIISFLGIYNFEVSAIGNSTKAITVDVEKGDTYFSMASKLKEKDLIRSEFFYKMFLKLHKPGHLVIGSYDLNQSMSVAEIVETLGNENNLITNESRITFKEGLNVRQMASLIEEKTTVTADEFLNQINDESYINELQSKYWFITDEVKDPSIYYDLEGYLYPDTYIFEKEGLSPASIIEKMLDNTENKLEDLKNDISSSHYTTHEVLTLASMIEQEAVTDSDRKLVSSVFHNRLDSNWALGSDVTSYYGAKKALSESITSEELNKCNGYNTRCKTMIGLPVGPIDNPSLTSIKAALYPTDSNYYYFVADSEKKVYFSKTASEQTATINKLKAAGKWIE